MLKVKRIKISPSTNSSSTNTYVIFNTKEFVKDLVNFSLFGLGFYTEENGEIENALVYSKKQAPFFNEYLGGVLFELIESYNSKINVNKIESILKDILAVKNLNNVYTRRFRNVTNYVIPLLEGKGVYYTKYLIHTLLVPENPKTNKRNYVLFRHILGSFLNEIREFLVVVDVSEDASPTPINELKKNILGKINSDFSKEKAEDILSPYKKALEFGAENRFLYDDFEISKTVKNYYKIFEGSIITYSLPPLGVSVIFDVDKELLDKILKEEEQW